MTDKSGSFFLSGLQLLFIGLKLGDLIDWSWWWVMSPLWITVVLAFIVAVVMYYTQKKEVKIIGDKP